MASWFPFTRDELLVAFLAQGLPPTEAEEHLASFLDGISDLDPDNGFGYAEVGNFLDPLASISEDCATRLSNFRLRWGVPNPGFLWEPIQDED